MNVTKADLASVLQEAAYRATAPMATGTPNSKLAEQIGLVVRDSLFKLNSLGYLPVGLGTPREVMVDYDRMQVAPQFIVTVRW